MSKILLVFSTLFLLIGCRDNEEKTTTESSALSENLTETFKNAFVIEETGDGFINHKYFVEDYGVIKTEAIMSIEQSEEVIVSSTLENFVIN